MNTNRKKKQKMYWKHFEFLPKKLYRTRYIILFDYVQITVEYR